MGQKNVVISSLFGELLFKQDDDPVLELIGEKRYYNSLFGETRQALSRRASSCALFDQSMLDTSSRPIKIVYMNGIHMIDEAIQTYNSLLDAVTVGTRLVMTDYPTSIGISSNSIMTKVFFDTLVSLGYVEDPVQKDHFVMGTIRLVKPLEENQLRHIFVEWLAQIRNTCDQFFRNSVLEPSINKIDCLSFHYIMEHWLKQQNNLRSDLDWSWKDVESALNELQYKSSETASLNNIIKLEEIKLSLLSNFNFSKFLEIWMPQVKNQNISGEKFYIFGAGPSGSECMEYVVGQGAHVLAFIDNNKALTSYYDLPVISPSQLKHNDETGIVLASKGHKDKMYFQLQSLGNNQRTICW
ncbi:MAG TPA: hypothetical protein VMS09_08270 [Paenibacillus sp.]|uniref:hypothetical protein n=1 Tax=Paenibacillus sp. TaxID=58172 RepID=UPI002C8859BB|nr:hypothetical protein [Paenibacillus sp.]HUC92009.1 hypothetical protein [Paenibacillus sp.]